MKIILLLITLFALPALVGAQQQATKTEKSAFIGYKYKGVLVDEVLPNGWKSQGGALITNSDSARTYSVSSWTKGRGQMVWLKIAIGEDKTGITDWEVKDAIVFSNLAKNQNLDWGGIACQQKKKPGSKIVVLTQLAPKSKTYKALRAWTVNLQTEKFKEMSIKDVQCIYEEP